MVLTLLRVQDVNGLVARFQPVLYERKQDAIFFLVIVEKRANVTGFAEMGPSQGNGCGDALHRLLLDKDIVNPGLPLSPVVRPGIGSQH